MWSRPIYLRYFDDIVLIMFFHHSHEVDLENVSPSIRWILGVIVNTLTADGRYFVEDYENLLLAIQMQLSEK